jgi:hypothetical protein
MLEQEADPFLLGYLCASSTDDLLVRFSLHYLEQLPVLDPVDLCGVLTDE